MKELNDFLEGLASSDDEDSPSTSDKKNSGDYTFGFMTIVMGLGLILFFLL